MTEPRVKPERWREMERIFLAALDRLPAERGAYLAEACGGDEVLRVEVEKLLQADADAGDFLARPLLDPPASPSPDEDYPLGSAIGPYRLAGKIGEGGMSTVFLAVRSDETYQKEVAIKFFRLGAEQPELMGRFRAERQILASLDHPYIAKLLDGGSTDRGTPYYIMEYVEGLPIDAYGDQNRLSIDHRLELFRKVCSAVQYAHANLIVHRDIKPSNLLVRANGEPKLLDFGIAKILDPQSLALRVDRTRAEHHLMTPAYASPEQVRGEAITTAADVYSLGVLLYELLTGRRPYDFDRRALPEMLRAITEDLPRLPSACLAADAPAASGPTVPALAAARATTPASLRRRLHGDLDNIVLKALRKEPTRRYSSVEQFSEDIRRHLAGLPVGARPDTLGYRAGKFLRRHRLGVATAALFAIVVVSFTGVTAVQSRRLARALDQAEKEAAKAKATSRFLQETLGAANPFGGVGREVTVLEVLRRTSSTIHDSFAAQPETEATVRATLGTTYLELGRLDEAEPQIETALAIRRRVLGRSHPEVAESLLELGRFLTEKGQLARAEPLLREAIALQTELFGAESLGASDALYQLGRLLIKKGEYDQAESVFRQCLAIRRRLLPAMDLRVARCLGELGWVRLRKGDYDPAEALFRESVAITEKTSPPRGPEMAAALHGLATLLDFKGDLAGAEPLFREVLAIRRALLGEEHTAVAQSLGNLGSIRSQRGFLDEATKLDREVLTIFRKVLGEESQETAKASMNLAADLIDSGRLDEARELLEKALAVHRKVWKNGHEDIANDLDNLGYALVLQRRYAEAERRLREALELRRALLGADHPLTGHTLHNLAYTLQHKGERRAAVPLYQESLQILTKKVGPDHPDIGICRSDFGTLLTELGRYEQAREQLVTAYSALKKALGPEHGETKKTARRLLQLGRAWNNPKASAEIQALLGTSGDRRTSAGK